MAERLRWARTSCELSLQEVEELSGVTYSYVSHIENHRRQNPGDETIEKLTRVFGVTPAWLVYGAGRQPSIKSLRAAVANARKAA